MREFDRLAGGAYALLVVLAFGWCAVDGRRLPFGPNFPPSGSELQRWLFVGLLLGGAIVIATHLLGEQFDFGNEFETMVQSMLGEVSWGRAFYLAALSSVGEELFFRGAVQPTFGLIPTTILFALAHFPARKEMASWTIFAGVVGLAIGYIFERSGLIVAPIVAHFVVNFINLRLIGQRRKD